MGSQLPASRQLTFALTSLISVDSKPQLTQASSSSNSWLRKQFQLVGSQLKLCCAELGTAQPQLDFEKIKFWIFSSLNCSDGINGNDIRNYIGLLRSCFNFFIFNFFLNDLFLDMSFPCLLSIFGILNLSFSFFIIFMASQLNTWTLVSSQGGPHKPTFEVWPIIVLKLPSQYFPWGWVGGWVKVGIEANSAQPTELKLD